MLRIRLQRGGRKKSPFYHVVVAEKLAPIKGRVVERIGFYNPLVQPWSFEVDMEKAMNWIKRGAQPTNTVARLLKASGAEGVDRFIIEMVDRKKKNAPDEPEESSEPKLEKKEDIVETPAKEEVEEPAKSDVVAEEAPSQLSVENKDESVSADVAGEKAQDSKSEEKSE